MRMRRFNLKMNPLKCAFGVQAGNFLGFLVHRREIEVDKQKTKAILEAQPRRNKKGMLGTGEFPKVFHFKLSG